MIKTSVEGFRFEVPELGSKNPNISPATVRIQSMDGDAHSFSTCRVPLRWDEGPSRSGFPVSEKSLVSLESDPSTFSQIRKITCFQFQGWTLKLRSVRCDTQPAGFEICLSVTWILRILDPGYVFLKCSSGKNKQMINLGGSKSAAPKPEVPNFLTSEEASCERHACRRPRCRTTGEEGLQPPAVSVDPPGGERAESFRPEKSWSCQSWLRGCHGRDLWWGFLHFLGKSDCWWWKKHPGKTNTTFWMVLQTS